MNNVLPGWIDSLPATDERRDSVPMKRYGKAEEIAATIAFLVSDGGGLHHRPKHPRRRWLDALGVGQPSPNIPRRPGEGREP